MNNYNLLFLPLFLVSSLFSQHKNEPCGFDLHSNHSQSKVIAEQKISNEISAAKSKKQGAGIMRIPVVVHVIHDGGASNISDAQIQSQIDVMNEDFRKITGTNGDGNGADTEIEFCLAKKDPLGKCTNGIVRINSSLSNHQTYQRSMLSQLSHWDNLRYLNIYIVKNINNGSGTLGYASFPGGPSNEDGIVVRHDYFGKIGTASGLGRTATHEAGHYFGLYHTFQDGCGADTCLDGDKVCDTPPAANPNYGCPIGVNSCANDLLPDQIANYMDYSNDNCKSMFSDGQKQRMHAALNTLRFDLWQQWNIDSTGCDSAYIGGNCNVIADYITLQPNICVGNTIKFYDKSQNNPVSWQWTFTGGSPSTSTAANPSVTYPAAGTFPVKLVVSNLVGTDSLEISGYIFVGNPTVGQALPYFEGFEGTAFPPAGMTIENGDNGVTWERDTSAIPYSGNASAKINNLINLNYGQSDALILPIFDFTTASGTPYMSLRWAYARSDANYSDEMLVLVSKDCGVNWQQVLYRTGSALATGPTQTTPYIPDSSTAWKTSFINLNSFASFQSVMVKIVNVTDGGNNLYIDNINIGANLVGIDEEKAAPLLFHLYPNPVSDNFSIDYFLNASSDVELSIYDISGRQVYTAAKNNMKNGNHSEKITANFGSGMFFVRISANGKSAVQKLIIEQ